MREIINMITLQDLVTVEEAAQLLRVSTSAVRAWLSKGRLHRVKAGRRTLVAKSDLVAFLKASEPPTVPTNPPE